MKDRPRSNPDAAASNRASNIMEGRSMLSQRQIMRLVDAEEYKVLVERILANGRCPSGMTRQLLTRPEVAAPAGIGLTLQRLTELTYGPSPVANHLARRLLAMQRRDGLFGYGSEPTNELLLAATAAALRGMLAWVEQHRAMHQAVPVWVENTINLGLDALAAKFNEKPNMIADAVGWAIVLWQLGDQEAFRSRVPVAELL